jgi:hypothetical protein
MLLDILLPAAAGDTSPAQAMASFCPECLGALTPGVYACPHCGLKFRNEKSAALHALVIPGGAYFYVNLNLWGIAHAFIDVGLFASAILWVLAAAGKAPPQPIPGGPPGKLLCLYFASVPTVILALELWLAIRIARRAVKNFIPES